MCSYAGGDSGHLDRLGVHKWDGLCALEGTTNWPAQLRVCWRRGREK